MSFSQIFKEIITRYKNHTKWDAGDFVDIKKISNTMVGSVGQEFIEKLCEHLGIPFVFPQNLDGTRKNQSPWDIKIGDITFELKTATEDVSGNFQFNHIRYHRPYQAVLCLGVSPNDLFFNVWSKADITTGRAGNLVSMEKGANASYKLTKSKRSLLSIAEFEERIRAFIGNSDL